jgi:hypothetical protein
MVRIKALAFSTLLLTGLAMSGGTALAQTSHGATPGAPKGVIVTTRYRAVYKHDQGAHSGDWVRCVFATKQRGAITLTCTRTLTVTESVSGSAGLSASGISSSVGFNISFATAIAAGASVKVKAGGSGWLDDGFRYEQYAVGIQTRRCAGPCAPWSKTRQVIVQRHLGNTFRYFGTGAE